jgi:hypothetical protein
MNKMEYGHTTHNEVVELIVFEVRDLERVQ